VNIFTSANNNNCNNSDEMKNHFKQVYLERLRYG
jgi:hypothetical protein